MGNNNTIIGRVAALEKMPSTINEFFFWTRENTILNPFDVVVVDHILDTKTYGVVEEISHITDAESFLSSYISNDFGDTNCPMNSENIRMNYVKARVVGNTSNIYIPVHNGRPVRLGDEREIEQALGLDNMKNPVVCGFLEMYSNLDSGRINIPVYVNSDFLVGPEGAHLNISGISGLASKTSYAMFLLNALQQETLKRNSNKSIAYIFLNVKGRDLLTIDEVNDDLPDLDKDMYKKMGLEIQPFRQVTYFYPAGKGSSSSGKTNSCDTVCTYARSSTLNDQFSDEKAYKYKYTYNDDKENIDLLFSNIDDPNQTIDSIVNYIIEQNPPFDKVSDWGSMLKEIGEKCKSGQKGNNEISVLSWRKFRRIIRKSMGENPLFSQEINSRKQEKRLEDAIKNIQNNDVFVIDIAKQEETMQAFIFGTVMEAVQKLKLGEFDDDLEDKKSSIPDRIIIFVDELNKYASNDTPKTSPILARLLDIAERGRSLGIILFSAEQFKSSVHKRVTGNCAMHLYGRTNNIEVNDKTYSFISPTYKNIMTRLKQGDYIIQNPIFNSLLKIRFPMPLYKQDKGDTK